MTQKAVKLAKNLYVCPITNSILEYEKLQYHTLCYNILIELAYDSEPTISNYIILVSIEMAEKRKRKWAQVDMDKAYEAVKDGMSINASANAHGVPRMTLSDRVKGKFAVDAHHGRRTALSTEDEDALVKYIGYMHERRFPITRTQVMGFAWAIDMSSGKESRFPENGPTFKWWRGFRNRHPQLTLRKTESVERGRVSNATEEIVDDYFAVLEETIKANNLDQRSHLIYNCDEAAVYLNKSSQKVVFPRNSKHCHSLAQGTSEHISVLCCVNATGAAVPPLIVFAKGFPSLRGFQNDGCTNATYSTSDSGFVNRDIYASWFKTNFIKNASSDRPLLLIQDGATAHISPELIQTAIDNDIILLCLPSKLTHILQPLDVVIFRKMKSEISAVMKQVKMMRGDVWISKAKFPAVFREVFERTFVPSVIIESFRKCGIFPLNRHAINNEMLNTTQGVTQVAKTKEALSTTSDTKKCFPPTPAATQGPPPAPEMKEKSTPTHDTIPGFSPTSDTKDGSSAIIDVDSSSCCIAEISLDVIKSLPSGAHMVMEATDTSSGANTQKCPPYLALQAIETAITPKKLAKYNTHYQEGHLNDSDPVFTAWRNLKRNIDIEKKPIEAKVQPTTSQPDDHPLVRAGLIPRRLSDILLTPPEKSMRAVRINSVKARVLTSDEISAEIKAKDNKRKQEEIAKDERKRVRLEKKAAREEEKKFQNERREEKKRNPNSQRMTRNKKSTEGARMDYFEDMQNKLAACSSVDEMKTTLPHILSYPLNGSSPTPGMIHKYQEDLLSERLLQSMGIKDMYPISVMADGNCLPRVASFLCWGTEKKHVEMRVRIVHESIHNQHLYLDDDFLDGARAAGSTGTADAYAQYSDGVVPGTKLSKELTRYLFRDEVMNVAKRGAYCGIWQIHAVANILCRAIISVYPGLGPPRIHLNRTIDPQMKKTDCPAYIMWTSTCNADRKTWWQPNHFIPLVRRHPSDQNVTQPDLHAKHVSQDKDSSMNVPQANPPDVQVDKDGGPALTQSNLHAMPVSQDKDSSMHVSQVNSPDVHVAKDDGPALTQSGLHAMPVSQDKDSSMHVSQANPPDVQVAKDDGPALTHSDLHVMPVPQDKDSSMNVPQANPPDVQVDKDDGPALTQSDLHVMPVPQDKDSSRNVPQANPPDVQVAQGVFRLRAGRHRTKAGASSKVNTNQYNIMYLMFLLHQTKLKV